MMKTMTAENGVTFQNLEKNIYKWICQIGQDFTKDIVVCLLMRILTNLLIMILF